MRLASPFDPSSIPPFSVIRVPYRFGNEPPVSKLFVVLGHKSDGRGIAYAIAIKATSNEALYAGDARRRQGCVCYPPGALECFPRATFVEPDNQFPIKHMDIRRAYQAGQFELHCLPEDFEQQLCTAIKASITMSLREKQRMAEFVRCP
jgi:hypothetical protein